MRQEKYLVFLSIQHLDLIIYHYYIGRHITAPRIQKRDIGIYRNTSLTYERGHAKNIGYQSAIHLGHQSVFSLGPK